MPTAGGLVNRVTVSSPPRKGGLLQPVRVLPMETTTSEPSAFGLQTTATKERGKKLRQLPQRRIVFVVLLGTPLLLFVLASWGAGGEAHVASTQAAQSEQGRVVSLDGGGAAAARDGANAAPWTKHDKPTRTTINQLAKTASRVLELASADGAAWDTLATRHLPQVRSTAEQVAAFCAEATGVAYSPSSTTGRSEESKARWDAMTPTEQHAATSLRLHQISKLMQALENRAKKLARQMARKGCGSSACLPLVEGDPAERLATIAAHINDAVGLCATWLVNTTDAEEHDVAAQHKENAKAGSSMARRVFRATKEAALDKMKAALVERKVRSPSEVEDMEAEDLENTLKVESGLDTIKDVLVERKVRSPSEVEHMEAEDLKNTFKLESALHKMKAVLVERKVRSPSEVERMASEAVKNTFKLELIKGGHSPDIDIEVDIVKAHRPAVELLPEAEAVAAALAAGTHASPDILALEWEKRVATATMKDILLLRNVRTLDELDGMDANEIRDILKVEAIEKLGDTEHANLNMWTVTDADLLYLAGKLKDLYAPL